MEQKKDFKINVDAITAAVIDTAAITRYFEDHRYSKVIFGQILKFLLPKYYADFKVEGVVDEKKKE